MGMPAPGLRPWRGRCAKRVLLSANVWVSKRGRSPATPNPPPRPPIGPHPTPESTIRPSTIDNSRVSAPQRVQQALDALGLPGRVRVFDDGSTHTAQEAADAVGCALGQIVKTLFFMAESRPTMVLAAGDRQVDTALLAPILGVGRKKLKMGTPAEVMEYTGYPVGGVAPVGWPKPVDVVVDDSLKRFDEVWAAAGAPNAVFPARTEDLVRAVNGQWAAVVRSPG